MEELRERWVEQKAGDPMPLAEELFLAEWYEQMPNLLLARNEGRTFKPEYLGTVARQYFVNDIMSDFRVQDGLRSATLTRLPFDIITKHWRGVFLPFASEFGAVYVVLAGFTGR